MSTLPPTRLRRRRWSFIGPLSAAAVLIGMGAALWLTGLVDLSRWGLKASAGASRSGLVGVPVSAQAIPAYTKVTRDHLWNPRTNELAIVYLSPEQVAPEMLTSLQRIVGRVLDHEKPAGYAFTREDFLPEGTRPGLVAGIPPGKRAIRVEADRVNGLFGLNPGDRFDLVATIPIDTTQSGSLQGVGGLYGQQLNLQAQLSNWRRQATVSVLVQNGAIVEPMVTRQVPVFSRTLTQGAVTRMRPVQEIVIAVDPEEVAPLTEAMAVEASISAVPRSGQPGDDPDSFTPGSRPRSPIVLPGVDSADAGGLEQAPDATAGVAARGPMTMVETISGTERQLTATPSR
jgi:Flp pilus assembly protein CpaB